MAKEAGGGLSGDCYAHGRFLIENSTWDFEFSFTAREIIPRRTTASQRDNEPPDVSRL